MLTPSQKEAALAMFDTGTCRAFAEKSPDHSIAMAIAGVITGLLHIAAELAKSPNTECNVTRLTRVTEKAHSVFSELAPAAMHPPESLALFRRLSAAQAANDVTAIPAILADMNTLLNAPSTAPALFDQASEILMAETARIAKAVKV